MADNPSNEPAKATPLYAGKYKTSEEFESGYWNLHKEGLNQREGRVRAEAERDALKAQLSAQPTSPNPHEANLREAEIPIDDLNAVIEQRATEAAQRMVQETLGPLAQASAAQQELSAAYSDFDLGKVQEAVSKDPMVSEQYQNLLGSDPRAAYMMGYQALKASTPPTQETKHVEKQNQQPSQDQQVHAGVPRSTGAGAGQPIDPGGTMDPQTYDALLQKGYNGDWRPFLNARLGEVLDEHIDPTLHRPDEF